MVAIGFKRFMFVYFGVEPWTGSNMPYESPMFASAAKPKLPPFLAHQPPFSFLSYATLL